MKLMPYQRDKDAYPMDRAYDGDAGLDLRAFPDGDQDTIPAYGRTVIPTGIHIELPEDTVGLVWSRSGLSVSKGLEVGAGCIDPGYRGEVKVVLYNHSGEDVTINEGDKIAQLLVLPLVRVSPVEVDELGPSTRGLNGFGSSGR